MSDKNEEKTDGKRKRVDSSNNDNHNFSWLTASSPPKFISLDDLLKTADGLDKMALAHEIAVNADFKLNDSSIEAFNKSEPSSASNSAGPSTPIKNPEELRQNVKRILHQAFWDVLKSDLGKTPPIYEHAFGLLKELKENVLSFLLPHHQKLKVEIEENIDLNLIEQQCEKNCFDFLPVAKYILDVLSKLCAPVRDDTIKMLKEEADLISLFRGTFELIDAMKIDMANFTLVSMRPVIEKHSAEYERKKFDEFLAINPNALENTEIWLENAGKKFEQSHQCSSAKAQCSNIGNEEEEKMSKTEISDEKIISEALWSLINSENNIILLPETFLVDESRLNTLRDICGQIVLISSIIATTVNFGGANFSDANLFKMKLKDTLKVLFEDCKVSECSERLKVAAEKVCQECEKYARETDLGLKKEIGFAKDWDSLKIQLKNLTEMNNPVRKVMSDRIKFFVLSWATIGNRPKSPVKIPAGLNIVEKELACLTGAFMKLVTHNVAVFGDHYRRILKKIQKIAKSTEEST